MKIARYWMMILSLSLTVSASAACQKKKANPMDADSTVVPPGSTVLKLSGGKMFSFLEGPVWDGAGRVYFTDIPNNRIYTYSLSGGFTVFREGSNGSNGLMFDEKKTPAGLRGRSRTHHGAGRRRKGR